MINFTDIATCTNQLVGYRNSDDPCTEQITGDATGATSNVYVTDIPGMTPELLQFAAKSASYSDLSTYVNDVIKKEALNAMKDFVRRQKELTKARHLMDNVDIVKNVQHMADKVNKIGRFVGVRITPEASDNIKVWDRKIGVQFDTLNPTLKIYLFETSQEDPIRTFTLTGHNKVNSLQWFDLKDENWFQYYKDKDGGTQQRFYLGYFENDLLGQAIDTQFICGDCGSGDFWTDLNKHVAINGLEFGNSALNGTKLPNTKKVGLTNQTYGLHLKLSVTCDITETLCDNIDQFDRLIQHKAAIRSFKDYFNTVEIGRESELARNNALSNLDMVESDYDNILKGLKLDYTDLDSICFPCTKSFNKSGQLHT